MGILQRIKNHIVPKALAPHIQVGKSGEDIAAGYLRAHGFSVLERNVRVGTKDEVDIIAFDPTDSVYVFAEVKTRTRKDDDYRPELNITREKRERMARAARRFMAQKNKDIGYRLDVLLVVEGAVTDHYKEISWEN